MARWKKPSKEEVSACRSRLRDKAAAGELRFPTAVVVIRKSLGLTQEQFASITGITKRLVLEIEDWQSESVGRNSRENRATVWVHCRLCAERAV